MAYHLCSSPSSLFHNRQTPSHSLPSPRSFRLGSSSSSHSETQFSFTPLKNLSPNKHVSLQEPVAQETQTPTNVPEVESPQRPNRNSGSLSKSYIWVNPSSPRASQLRQKSYDSRYASLVKVAEYLNSCSPSENDVFEALKGLGDRILEQDAVVVLNNMANPENALLALKYFQQNLKPKREVILYNVTLKVCRKGKDLDRAEKLFDELLKRCST
ncbi:pentatricopeptide repeat-containing protein [Prunus yedoensis var. nudiflora]|uniref:Pentatricopeptide repeat-containing protein n=1 Tax=Prunus yedoensis var. nudiflora TaxID=2094558 RepID=A0A314XXE0_PRUYE|nr:pentatricopeptide repeat-containing protein [Prunus yedoensis var. nudiflora]